VHFETLRKLIFVHRLPSLARRRHTDDAAAVAEVTEGNAAMDPIVTTLDIARPPDEVFAVATDPTRFAQWQTDVVRVETDQPVPLSVGARFTTIRRIGGVERAIAQHVAEVVKPYRWVARSQAGPIRPTATITIEPIEGGTGSRVTFTLDYIGHGIGVPLLPLVRRQTRRGAPVSYRRLKQLLESGPK
jgi:uncharacterized protein YndB with AHSA1/START domain